MMHRLNNTYLPSICAHQDISRKFVSQNTKKYTKEIPYLYWTTGNIKSESWKLKLHSRMHKPAPQSLVLHYKPRKLQPLSTTPPLAEIEIRLTKLEKDRQRYQNLVKRNAATPIQLEQIETEYAATHKKLEAVKRQQKAALSGVNEVSHRRENTEAAIQRATAALEMARLNLSYTVVVAPCDGKLGRRTLEEGQFITAGQTITYILPDTQKWIIANYKETQIENLHLGQEVAITVDAISGKEFKGKITAISGATGSKYSLVPTDNSAGNFVKIQQRIPVRIDFTDLSKEDNSSLAAGMMVIVKAKTKK